MKGRDQGKTLAVEDMMVCFPTRPHLRLMPKPICSPARPSEIGRHRRRNSHHMRSFSISAADENLEISEPSSPKVTCAGQIKVRPRRSSCNSWRQSVMEEFERIQSNRKQKALRLITSLRSLRLDFRCFGGVHEAGVTSDEDEEDEDGDGSDQVTAESRKVYSSNWYMFVKEEKDEDETDDYDFHENDQSSETHDEVVPATPPPPNALLLMRCRSAPAKTWKEDDETTKQKAELFKEEKVGKKGEAVRMSTDAVEQAWLSGGIRDIILPRSRSCRRW